MDFDFIIVGGGITGITLCKKLREIGVTKLLVLEADSEAGGLCRTAKINGHTLDLGGGHFFNTKHKEVFDFVTSYIPTSELNYFDRVSKLSIRNSTIDYPIESNLWQLPIDQQAEFIISVIRNGESLAYPEPSNYEEWIRWKLGINISEEYMIPYNQKLWGVPPSAMDIDWLHKIPRVDVREVLMYCLNRKQDVNKFPAHINFYYPKSGGFQSIFNALYNEEMRYVKTNSPVISLEKNNNGTWKVNNQYNTRYVINTAPWSDLFNALGRPTSLHNDFNKLRYNKITISLFEHHYNHDWHWRYVPDINTLHHREFYISNFAMDSKSNGLYTETNSERFDRDMHFQGTPALFHYTTRAAYPIPILGHKQAIDNVLDYYRKQNLFGVGRWGQHDYQNADVSIHNAIKFVESWDKTHG